MTGYNPNCDNCFKRATCRGDGTIQEVRSGQAPDGSYKHWKERVTCPTCRGVGGKAGAGKHNHN